MTRLSGKRMSLGIAALVALAMIALAGRGLAERSSADTFAPSAGDDLADAASSVARLHRVAGEHQSWRMDFDSESTTSVSGATEAAEAAMQIAASFALSGRLHEQVVDVLPDGTARVRVWVDEVESAELSVHGSPVAGVEQIAGELATTSLDLEVDPCGRIVRYAMSDNGGTASQMLLSVVEAGYPSLCGEPRAEHAEARRFTPHGDAVDTIATAGRPDGFTVQLVERRYEQLRVGPGVDAGAADVQATGSALIVNGRLAAAELREQVGLSDGSMRLLDATTVVVWSDARALPSVPVLDVAADWQPSGERTEGQQARRMMLQQRAGDLSGERLLGLLASEGVTGTLPDHNDTLWQAPARLELEPELIPSVVDVLVGDSTSSSGRGLMLDLLVQTRSEVATAGAMAALQHPAVRADRFYPVLLQRVGFVQRPTPELVQWTTTLLDSQDFNERTAALYAGGSLISTVDQSATPELVDGLHARVVSALNDAVEPTDRVHGIRALANAARAADLPILVSNRVHEHPDVRAALASSLGSFPQAVSTDALLELAADVVPSVQREAIAGLRNHSLGQTHLERLTSAVVTETVDQALLMPLLDLAKYYVDSAPTQVRALCTSILARDPDARTTAAADELMRWVAAR